MATKPLTEFQQQILDWFANGNTHPISYAKEVGEVFGTTSQKASGSLRVLENRGLLVGYTVGSGMHATKLYYHPDIMKKFAAAAV